MIYTLDCEFDGHGGPLLSLALIPEVGTPFYYRTGTWPKDRWVQENVVPIINLEPGYYRKEIHDSPRHMGMHIKNYLAENYDGQIHIIADSPVDIWRICEVMSTDYKGQWESSDFPEILFTVFNVDCWPNDLPPEAQQHNAYWDAMALWEKIYAAD